MNPRPAQTNCRNEPGYPDHPTVLFVLAAPDLTMHPPSPRCAVEEPHAIHGCGEFEGEKKYG